MMPKHKICCDITRDLLRVIASKSLTAREITVKLQALGYGYKEAYNAYSNAFQTGRLKREKIKTKYGCGYYFLYSKK